MAGDTLVINGFDFEPYLIEGGIKWRRNDVDSPESGEMADGTMRRDRVIVRPTMDITIANQKFFIDDELIHQMMSAIEPQWVSVKYFDPRLGQVVTRQFYSNNVGCTLLRVEAGRRRWAVDPFPLIAQGVAGDGRSNPE
jgi:Holliday junction resolvasome RuvABC ATP-dependent DNA helicase subunit